MSYDLANCIAMSEDGDWFAFPRSLTRGQVMHVLAANCMSWYDAIHYYRIRAGHVCPDSTQHDWWSECDQQCARSSPAWIVTPHSRVDTPANPV